MHSPAQSRDSGRPDSLGPRLHGDEQGWISAETMDAETRQPDADTKHRAPLPGRTATAIGFGAVILWGTLATLTTLKGGG